MVKVKITSAGDSKKYELNQEDLAKVAKGAVIAISGALLTFIAETIPNVDFGDNTALVVAISSIAINFAWKMLRGQQ